MVSPFNINKKPNKQAYTSNVESLLLLKLFKSKIAVKMEYLKKHKTEILAVALFISFFIVAYLITKFFPEVGHRIADLIELIVISVFVVFVLITLNPWKKED
jgi:hypothetical membrane protein